MLLTIRAILVQDVEGGDEVEMRTKGVGLSVLEPFFKGMGPLCLPDGYRPLRLVIIFRKIHEMGLTKVLRSEGEMVLEQFRFESKIPRSGRQRGCWRECLEGR